MFQRGTWLPREASIHLLLATPQSSIPRDMSLDLAFSPRRLLLKIIHPLKSIHIHGRPDEQAKTTPGVWIHLWKCVLSWFFCVFVAGQLEQERNTKSAKLELMIDGVHHYIMVNIVLKFSKIHSISFILNHFPVLKTCISSTAGFDGHPDLPVGAEDSLPPWSQDGPRSTSHDPLC